MEKNIATLSNNLDTVAKWLRLMEKGGMEYDPFLATINSRKNRKNLIEYINQGCPTIQKDGLVKVITLAKPQILRLISRSGEIILQPTDGSKTFAKAKDIFTGYLDSDFKKCGTDKSSAATKETKTSVYEMAQDSMFANMFTSLSSNLDKLCLTQHQAIQFVQDYRSWLRKDGYGTFFLFRAAGQFFVANVYVNSVGELHIYVDRFGDDDVWRAEFAHRVVVPQLR